MHAFITLCLLAGASAELGGYNYNRIGLPAPLSGLINLSPSIGTAALRQQPQLQQQQQQQQQYFAPAVSNEVSKEFYTFSAPAEEFSYPQAEQEIPSLAKKNVQVIFIHAPEQTGLNRVVQNLAQQTLEQQTAIYVLTKQADLGQLANSFRTNVNRVVHKPEVHFVKYRTQQDAAQAQQSIRAKYDTLGGSSVNSDEGVAPVLNFASAQQLSGGHGLSQGQGIRDGIASQQVQPAQIPQQPSQSYLPAGL